MLIRNRRIGCRLATLFQLGPLTLICVAQSSRTPAERIGSLFEADPGYQIVERGQHFAVFRKITTSAAGAGYTVFRTNQFTLLENNLHYLENGQWELSEDIVEPFPGGAVARHGPHQTIFSRNLARSPCSTFKRRKASESAAACGAFS